LEEVTDPTNYDRVHKLDSGVLVHLRAIRPDDKQSLSNGFHELSNISVFHRFFTVKHDLSEEDLQYLTEVDFKQHIAIGAAVVRNNAELPAGIGRYILLPDDAETAEFSITVKDIFHHQGIGTLLFEQLTEIARSHGVRILLASVMLSNRFMQDILEHSGYPLEKTLNQGILQFRLNISGDNAG